MSRFIAALRPFTSCDIGDALVKLQYPHGGFLDGITMWSPVRQGHGGDHKVIGAAVTVKVFYESTSPLIVTDRQAKMVDAKDESAPGTPRHFADANEDGKIMYIQQPKDMYSACFGGLMATRAKMLNAAGVVIDGRFRDIAEIQELGLPVCVFSCVDH